MDFIDYQVDSAGLLPSFPSSLVPFFPACFLPDLSSVPSFAPVYSFSFSPSVPHLVTPLPLISKWLQLLLYPCRISGIVADAHFTVESFKQNTVIWLVSLSSCLFVWFSCLCFFSNFGSALIVKPVRVPNSGLYEPCTSTVLLWLERRQLYQTTCQRKSDTWWGLIIQ